MEVEKLRSDESELSGRWIWDGETMQRDSTEQRIQALIDHQLERIADGDGGWSTPYRDPADGRYWELTYPHSEMQGGGPARLAVISPAEAEDRYGN
jgi:hypothetical protein